MPVYYRQTANDSKLFPTSGTGLNVTHSIESPMQPHNLNIVDNPAKNGTNKGAKAIRFRLDKSDPLVGSAGKHRLEIVVTKASEDKRFTPKMFYSFDIMFPSVGFAKDSSRDCINQWYEDGSTECTLRCQDDLFFFEWFTKRLQLFTGTIPKDVWYNFAFNIYHTKGADGFIKIWRNGVLIHDVKGPTIHLQLPKWKVGDYKSSYDSSKETTRVIYFNNITAGNDGTTLEEMIANGSIEPPVNLPPIVSAGIDATIQLPVNSVTLKAVSSDPDGVIASTVWSQISGPSATLTENIVTNMVEGIYTFKVIVTDNKGAITSDTVNVTVLKAVVVPPPPPVVDKFSIQTIVKKNGAEIKNTTIDF